MNCWNHRLQRGLACLYCALALLAAGCAAPDIATHEVVAPTVSPLVPYGGDHWAIKADVAGHEEFVVFDTGGGFTAISPQAATALGCKPWGRITGFRMRGDRLDVQRCDNIAFIAHGASAQEIKVPLGRGKRRAQVVG